MQIVAWTEDRIADLTRLYSEGYSCSQIAHEIGGTTRNAVIGKIHRLRLPTPENKIRRAAPRAPREPKEPRLHTPRVRIIAANGNSNALRVVQVTETAQRKLRCVEIEPRNLSLLDLGPGECRYPYGDASITFCGHPAVAGSSYCRPHHDLCWVKPIPSKPKARVYAGTDFARSA